MCVYLLADRANSGAKREPAAMGTAGQKIQKNSGELINAPSLSREKPMRPTTAENTTRALIDHLDEQRLRALIVELALPSCAAWRPVLDLPWLRPPANERRRRHWSRARRAAENTKRREKRRAAPRRRSRRSKVDVSGNGSEPTADASRSRPRRCGSMPPAKER